MEAAREIPERLVEELVEFEQRPDDKGCCKLIFATSVSTKEQISERPTAELRCLSTCRA